MTPRRWLLVASAVALLYMGQLITAYIVADTALPAQINSVILTIMAVGFTLAGYAEIASRSERRLAARWDEVAEHLDRHHDVLVEMVALHVNRTEENAKRIAEVAERLDELHAAVTRGHVSIHARIDGVADEVEARIERSDTTVHALKPGGPRTTLANRERPQGA